MKIQITLAVLLCSGFSLLYGCGNNTSTPAAQSAPKPDNTAVNKVDQNGGTKTPMDQSESAADIKITAEIRRAVLDDKGLSTDAHNAKIVTANGMVALRGVVDNPAEKSSLESKARSVAGVTGVDNQLEVKNP